MTLVWLESWDDTENQTYLDTRLAGRGSSSGGGMASTNGGRHGGNAAVGGGASGTQFARTGFPAAATYVSGQNMRQSGTTIDGTGNHAMIFTLGAVDQMTLRWVEVSTNSEEYRLEVRRGGLAGSVLATMTQALHRGAWHYIEFKVLADATVGTYEVKIDGTTVLSDTALDTTGAGSPNIDGHEWAMHPNAETCDIYVLNGLGGSNDDFLGHVYVEGLRPTGNGNQNDWTGVSGTNFANVDEPGTGSLNTDHNQTSTATDVDLYGYPDLVRIKGTGATLPGVQVITHMALALAGSENMANTHRSGGLEADAATQVVDTTTQRTREDVLETNVAESAAWTVAKINAAEFGVEMKA